MRISSARTLDLPAAPPVVWSALCAVDAYTDWWPWLRRLDARALAVGETWSCTIQPPLPYTIRCRVRIDRVDPGRMVAASVHGDIVGSARLDLEEHPGGTRARLVSDLAPSGRWVSAVARVLPPVARWGHDRVVQRAEDQFGAALADGARTLARPPRSVSRTARGSGRPSPRPSDPPPPSSSCVPGR